MIPIYGLLMWLYQNVFGNLVASGIAFGTGYVWKIRPHLKRQQIHREDTARALAELQERK